MQALKTTLRGIESAIVDLDGTLVETVGDFELALNRMLGERVRQHHRSAAADAARHFERGGEAFKAWGEQWFHLA